MIGNRCSRYLCHWSLHMTLQTVQTLHMTLCRSIVCSSCLLDAACPVSRSYVTLQRKQSHMV